MPTIHPTAVVEPGAELHETVVVGPYCHVGPKAVIGARTRLVSHVCVLGRTTMGCDNIVWPFAVIGADPQDLKYRGEETELLVGDGNLIRESVTIHTGTVTGGGRTLVGSHNLIMVGSHVAHDCQLGSHIVIANNVGLAGHTHIEDHANLGGFVGVHHFVTIGQYSFVGGMTRVVQDVPPYMVVEGNPARVRKVNSVGLQRHKFPAADIERIEDAYRRLYRSTASGDAEPRSSMAANLAKLLAEYPGDAHIEHLAAFLHKKTEGKYGRYRESQRSDDVRSNPTK